MPLLEKPLHTDPWSSKFKVIIVGGGIAGLALANSLQHTQIDYVVIEKRDVLDPQLGASVGILPNGARLLDQLGCFDDLEEFTVSMESTGTHRKDGSLIGGISDTLRLMERRTGYPVFFLDRQLLLRVLAKHIVNPHKTLLKKSVQTVEQHSDKAVVYCDDGTRVEGDIVVGADGTYSPVRNQMWKHADRAGDGERFAKDKEAMSAEYKCMFGISKSIPGMNPGQTDRTYAKDISTLSYVGKAGRIFWFVFVKMDKVYRPPDIPRFDESDAAALIQDHGSLSIRERGKVTVSNLYDARITCHLVAIEEAAYQHWSYGRIVCLGDSIHKFTPNLGAGASSGLESTAALTNVLIQMTSNHKQPSLNSITQAFKDFQANRQLRIARASAVSNGLTRVQTLKGPKEYFYTHFVAPRADDSAAEMFSSFVIGAPLFKHLPVPTRSIKGTMPFNDRQGWGYEEQNSDRIKRALPLVALTLISLQSYIHLDQPSWNLLNQGISVRFDNSSTSNLIDSACSDVAYGIMLLEANRLNNKGSLIQFPLIFGAMLQLLGVDVVAPLYLFLLYLQSPLENFRASDNRYTQVSYTSTVGALMIFFVFLPKGLETIGFQTTDSALFQMTSNWQPLLISVSQFLLAHSLIPNTVKYDRLWAVRRDMPWIRRTITILAVAAVLPWMLRFLPDLIRNPSRQVTGLWTSQKFVVAVMYWLLLVIRDLKVAGMVDHSWAIMVSACFALLTFLGPGGLLAIGWLWREETLLNRRHKDAVICN